LFDKIKSMKINIVQLVFMIFIHKVNADPHYATTALTSLVSKKVVKKHKVYIQVTLYAVFACSHDVL
jgi:hypothetical protein